MINSKRPGVSLPLQTNAPPPPLTDLQIAALMAICMLDRFSIWKCPTSRDVTIIAYGLRDDDGTVRPDAATAVQFGRS